MKSLTHWPFIVCLIQWPGMICFGVIGILLLGMAGGRVQAQPAPAKDSQMFVYIGTYTGAKSKGIYLYRLDLASGKLAPLALVAETVNPTYLAIHPSQRFLYAANEISRFNGRRVGAVSAFAIEPESGKLTLLNQQSSGGDGPCHLLVDRQGKNVLVANYGGGSVCVLPIQTDGRLGEATTFIQHKGSSVDRRRQEGPHAHGIALDAEGRIALVADLGLDKLMAYRLDAEKGVLTANEEPWGVVKPGSGPRHIAMAANGKFTYVINEMGSSITAFTYDSPRGALKEIQMVSTLPDDFKGENTCAEIALLPSGKFLYGSNRGHNSIAVFAIDANSGKLTFVEHRSTQGKTPRNFGIDPTGSYLLAANQDSNDIFVFRIDPETGKLAPTGQKVEVGAPVCVTFVPVPGK
jgi:6-phosphogluconolactonase